MTVKKKNKVNDLIMELNDALKFENEEERIELKASLIQLDIMEEVRRIMNKKNLTRKELAHKLGKSPAFITQLFSGDKLLNLKTIARLQEIFNVKFVGTFKYYSESDISKHFYKICGVSKPHYNKIAEDSKDSYKA